MPDENDFRLNVLMIGADTSSRGGMASVVKSLYHAYRQDNRGINLRLLKTCYYMDKGPIFELYIMVKSYMLFLYWLATFRPQVLHIHSSARFSFVRKSIFLLTGKLVRRRIVLHLHSSQFDSFFMNRSWILRWWIGSILRMADYVVVLCDEWKQKLESAYSRANVRKIANPIVLEPCPEPLVRPASGTLRVLFMGFLIQTKGVMDLLDVANCLKASGKPVKITVAGKGELAEVVKKRIVTDGLNEVLEYIGWIEGQAKERLFRSSDVLFLPSYSEGMPIVILEAMKFGLPIVSTRIAGIPEEVNEGVNGYLFEPGDVSGFCEALVSLAGDKDELISMATASRNKVMQFDASVVLDEIITLYRG